MTLVGPDSTKADRQERPLSEVNQEEVVEADYSIHSDARELAVLRVQTSLY
jgi:hypothetical protein